MPTQPSTQVVHIPLNGLTESSVRFLVSVAAEAFRRVKVMTLLLVFFRRELDVNVATEGPCDFAGVAWFEETHRVVVALEAHRREIQAPVAERRRGGRALASLLADGTNVETRAALAATLVRHMEGARDCAADAAAGEPDRPGHHLLLAHPYAQPAL